MPKLRKKTASPGRQPLPFTPALPQRWHSDSTWRWPRLPDFGASVWWPSDHREVCRVRRIPSVRSQILGKPLPRPRRRHLEGRPELVEFVRRAYGKQLTGALHEAGWREAQPRSRLWWGGTLSWPANPSSLMGPLRKSAPIRRPRIRRQKLTSRKRKPRTSHPTQGRNRPYRSPRQDEEPRRFRGRARSMVDQPPRGFPSGRLRVGLIRNPLIEGGANLREDHLDLDALSALHHRRSRPTSARSSEVA